MKNNRHIMQLLMLAALLTVFRIGLAQDPESAEAGPFGTESLRGYFAFSLDGTYSDLDQLMNLAGQAEPLTERAFSLVGLLHFNGAGRASGDAVLSSKNAWVGRVSEFDVTGSYAVDTQGHAGISLQLEEVFFGDFNYLDLAMECAIVRARRLARCVLVGLADPQARPATGHGSLVRQRAK